MPTYLRTLCLLLLSCMMLVLGPLPAQAQDDCGCSVFPYAGQYRSPEGVVFTISYLDGSDSDCPTVMGFAMPRGSDAVDAQASLTCEGGVWQGVENSVFQGLTFTFVWTVQASHYGGLVEPQRLAAVAGGMTGQTDQIAIDMQGGLQVGGQTRTFQARLASRAQALPCLCHAVRDAREDAVALRDAFQDQSILAQAIRDGVGANATNLPREYIDQSGNYHQWTGASEFRPSGTGLSYTARVAQAAAATQAADPVADGLSPLADRNGRLAYVDANNCRLVAPRNAPGRCEMEVLMNAVLTHEETHRRQCLDARRQSFFFTDGGRRQVFPAGTGTDPDWRYGEQVNLTITGNLANNRSRYESVEISRLHAMRSGHPHYRSLNEIEAYTNEIAVYDAYLAQHCGG